jgi:hypothetical protein
MAHRIDSTGTAAALPTPGALGLTVGYFTEGDPTSATPATVVSADWLNAVQEELAYVIEQAGITLDKTSRTQLKSAIDKLVGVSSTPVVITSASSPYTALSTARQVECNTTSGSITVNLPAVAGVLGKRFIFVKTNGSNTLTIDANGSETINGDLTQTITSIYSVIEVLATSGGWVVI